MSARKKQPKRTHLFELCNGVEGRCLYINGYRVAGPKPWGGGQIVATWDVTEEDMRAALDRKDGG